MAKIRNNRNICLNCFGDLGPDRVCVSCGKKADDSPNLPHHVAKRSLLKKRYLVDRAIGEGGFGITYLAWDVVKGVKVAVKEYYPSGYVSRDPRSNQIIINSKENHAASNRGLKRFIDEAKNLSGINDLSGIVSVFDFFSANNTAYIVMEYLDGISLKRYVQRKGKLSADTALTILKPVILSLESVHATGLIHRDISPDNILITKNNEVKLIDFGASKMANPNGQSVSIVLKQGFAPEEQYRLHGEQGPWTDIYAMGVTIYFCITGQLPPESIQRMYDDTILPPSQLGAKIGRSQEAALMKALAVFAKDRFRSIKDFAEELYKKDEQAEQGPGAGKAVSLKVESDGQMRIDTERCEPITEKPAAESLRITEKTEESGSRAEVPAAFAARQTELRHRISPDTLRRKLADGQTGASATFSASEGTAEEYPAGGEPDGNEAAAPSISAATDASADSDKIKDAQNAADTGINTAAVETAAEKSLITEPLGSETGPFRSRTIPTERKYKKLADRLVKLLNL